MQLTNLSKIKTLGVSIFQYTHIFLLFSSYKDISKNVNHIVILWLQKYNILKFINYDKMDILCLFAADDRLKISLVFILWLNMLYCKNAHRVFVIPGKTTVLCWCLSYKPLKIYSLLVALFLIQYYNHLQ